MYFRPFSILAFSNCSAIYKQIYKILVSTFGFLHHEQCVLIVCVLYVQDCLIFITFWKLWLCKVLFKKALKKFYFSRILFFLWFNAQAKTNFYSLSFDMNSMHANLNWRLNLCHYAFCFTLDPGPKVKHGTIRTFIKIILSPGECHKSN